MGTTLAHLRLKEASRFPIMMLGNHIHLKLTNQKTNPNSHKKWINFRGHSTMIVIIFRSSSVVRVWRGGADFG
jgi:hypothetical protein